MFKILVSIALIVGSVYGDLKDFADEDAFILAQQYNESLLEPSKDLYEQIHKELTTIRTQYPEVKDIHHQPIIELGKVIVNKAIDLNKLNSSVYGPIKVENIEEKVGEESYLVTFTKPYNTWEMEPIITGQFGKKGAEIMSARSVGRFGWTDRIVRSDLFDDLMYFFEKGSGDCFRVEGCEHKEEFSFTLKDGKWIKVDKIQPKSTTQKF